MKKAILLFLFFYSLKSIPAQSFERMTIPFEKFGVELKYALAGGLYSPQFSEVDLNNDAIKDMYIFDRVGNVSLTFINNGTANESDYEYAPYYQQFFPDLQEWVVLRDYNGDGIVDIFSGSDDPDLEFKNGIIVYKGHYNNGHLNFTRILFANMGYNHDVLPFQTNGIDSMIYVALIDYPAIDDIDGDGDLDILSFNNGGSNVSFYKNRSVEMGYGLDSLIYVLNDDCWGRFYENALGADIELSPSIDECADGFSGGSAEVRHAGSTLLTIDMDNDNDKELILGDLTSNNLVLLHNGGNNELAFMVDQDIFPTNTLALDITSFPAPFLMDVDNDGLKDILTSLNNIFGEDNKVWFYKNTSSNEFPVFQFVQNDFLVEHMVDLGKDAHPAFLDYNADGLLDLVVGNNTFYQPPGDVNVPRIYLFENIGTATSPEFNLIDDDYLGLSAYDGSEKYAPSPAFGDLDNDGDLDVLIGEKSGYFFYAENTAGPGNPVVFGNLQSEYMGLDVGQNAVPQIVDLDRDGRPDIIAGKRTGPVSYYHNDGTPNEPLFLPNINSSTPAGENIIELGGIDTRFGNFIGNAAPVILDFGGNYHIFTGSQAGYLMHYSNIDGNIGGNFTLETDYYGGIREGFNTHPAIADIDNDGILEMVVGNERGGLSIFKTNMNTVSTQSVYNKPEVNIFPNPAKGFFNIEITNGNNAKIAVSILNAVGQLILQDSFTGSNHEINCSSLSNGIYFAKLEIEGEVLVKKVVIGK